MQIINTIEQLRKTAKVSASMPWEVVEPFLQTARDMYLVRYLGAELVDVLELDEVPERAAKLLLITQQALGPLAMWVGNAELSVRIGDSGFTVEKNADKFVPASDTKILKVEDSLERRGFQYLDAVLEYLEENASDFPEFTNSRYYTLRSGNYIHGATQFQEIGLVDINYSRLTFEHLRPLMSMIEVRYINDLIGDTLDASLRTALGATPTEAQIAMIAAIRRFVACKTAELHTSQTSKLNRESPTSVEYKPIIRPIYSDVQNQGNFFAEQSVFYYNKIQQVMDKYALQLGIETVSSALEYNTLENKTFVDIG